jgi:hypothetical protein
MSKDVQFFNYKSGGLRVGVLVGDAVHVMSASEWLEFCGSVSSQIAAHLTQRAADACAAGNHDWEVVSSTLLVCRRCGERR